MGRDDRLKEIGRHAVPDHRLLPPHVREAVDRLPRNQRRVRKRIIAKSLQIAYGFMQADAGSGAGYPIDQQVREFLQEYNDRQLGHGLTTMPSSFNVFEGFLDFHANPPANFFQLRPERDHLFSFADFLDHATSADRRDEALRCASHLSEGVIHNFTPIGDARDLAFLHAGSARFVVAGFAMVRRESQIHWALVGGPVCDLLEETAKLKTFPDDVLHGRPANKAFIGVSPELEFRAEPLLGTDDVWKTVVFGIFNLETQSHEIRAVGRDHGNRYNMSVDDPNVFGVHDTGKLTGEQREVLDRMAEALGKDALLFEVAETMFGLPAYFEFRITLVRGTMRDTALAAMPASEMARIAGVPTTARPLHRRVASLEIVWADATPAIRAYTPSRYRIEVDGFWRRLSPGVKGRDARGDPVDGRTWVKGHMRWRDRPERKSVVFVKSSVAAARAKAAALVAGDAYATLVEGELPPTTVEAEPEGADAGWIYVMRCPLMDDDVYKVGWTSRPPRKRAEELSAATGVPLAYVVVESWAVSRARAAEAEVHLALSAFRINPRREFFKAPYETLRSQISAVMELHSAMVGSD